MKVKISRDKAKKINGIVLTLEHDEVEILLNSSVSADDYVSMLSCNFSQDITDLEKDIEEYADE